MKTNTSSHKIARKDVTLFSSALCNTLKSKNALNHFWIKMQNKNKENVSYQVIELVLQFLDASFSGQGGATLVQRRNLVAML